MKIIKSIALDCANSSWVCFTDYLVEKQNIFFDFIMIKNVSNKYDMINMFSSIYYISIYVLTHANCICITWYLLHF